MTDNINSLAHSKWNCKYHIEFAPKYRRQAILNALVHRDYSIHTEGKPIQIMIFADRLEIINPGGLYGRLSVSDLGKVQPDTRNPVIATALEVLNVTENRYTGVPTMRRELKEHGLPAPEFIDLRGEFKVIFRSQNDAAFDAENDRTAQLLSFCQTPCTRKELADFLGLSSVTYVIKIYIQPLIDSGKICMTESKPSSRNQKYYAK